MKDYYQILGISFNSTPDEIKKAYRKMALKYHPDRNNGEKYFTEKFQLIHEAFETLSNPEKKNEFDDIFSSKYNNKPNKTLITLNLLTLPDYVKGIAKEEILYLEEKIISLLVKEHLIDRMSYVFYALNLFQTYCERSPIFGKLAEEIKYFRKAPVMSLIDLLSNSKLLPLTNIKQSTFIDTFKKEQFERYSINDSKQENYLWARSLFIDHNKQTNTKLIIFEYYKIINYYSCFIRNSSN